MNAIHPVILSGGSGTRLWPLSRAMYPKQFIRFFNDQRPTFLAATLKRLTIEEGFARPIIVCNNDHRFLVKEETKNAGVSPQAIVLEPVARNTAPAAAVAALIVEREDHEGILVVAPSDHVIKDKPGFVAAVRRAAKVSERGKLVLFGITPSGPHTGYGYIRRGALLPGFAETYAVEAFMEKPDEAAATAYIRAGTCYWNSGIFVFRARAFLDELARLEPAILEAAKQALAAARDEQGFLRLEAQAFAKAPSISIDYSVMERTDAAAVVPIDIGWSDIGSWSSLWELSAHDEGGNAVRGEAILEDTTNCYVHSERGIVTTIGVKDLIIVDTPDALLVADRAKSHNVSAIVARLRAANRKEHTQHLRNYRPWGYFETLSLAPRFQVKLLHVKPGARLSMQMHHHRSEHWVVVHGSAKVTIGGVEKLVSENQSVYIVATQWHRLENPGKTSLELIEVQIGGYLGEDDIIRTEDDYNRGPQERQ